LDIPLGKSVSQPSHYAPEVLASIPRTLARDASGIDDQSFTGIDRWTAYEFVWIDSDGRAQPLILNIEISADSVNLVESKSLKLYLNSCYHKRFESRDEARSEVEARLRDCVLGGVSIELIDLERALVPLAIVGTSLDEAESEPDMQLATEPVGVIHEKLYTHVFRSLCPVTGQPDWASILIEYQGAKLAQPNLLSYLRSYSHHQGFHENCVELIYRDIFALEGMEDVAVCAKFLRRGGIDISPFRTSTVEFKEPRGRLIRQ
jgi:7-cyano-7-deazaguanine reductase